ncbi:hypothetical protein HUA74_37115 [Myxococcus sp. CA051A]|uniref:hypothetical protein n=1 Tax=Myxococcus sp. CA051A TaxID=2741739 RepID=UPI00157B860F|nr:hypothetical protein [Myxococcus sp. CA051A]NTX66293.1 hypothetical protein [Myxococcus sp. CA051A]
MAESSSRARAAGAWRSWPRSLILALGLGILVSLPSLRVGLLLDDLVHRLALSGQVASLGDWGPLTLYEFVGGPRTDPARLRESGLLPWWASDSLSVRFFRPLPSALLTADAWLFDDAPFPAHLHSLAWFLALVTLVGWLHRRLLPPSLAALATVLYAVAAAHLFPVAWLAARHPLVSALLGLLALAAHLRSREEGWKPGRVLAPLALVAALFSGEAALGAVGLIGAYEVFGRREGWRQCARRLMPYALLVTAYLFFYASQGYGARGSGGYLDPIGAPGAFLATLLQRVCILVGELVVATPSDAASGTPELHSGFAAWGALATVGALLMLRALQSRLSEQERGTLRWLLPGGLAATIPGAAGIIGGRVLMVPLLAGSALVAVLILRGWAAAREATLPRRHQLLLRSAVVVLVLGHGVLGPLFRVGLGVALGRIAEAQWRIAREAPPCAGTMVMVAAADPSISLYVPAAMLLQGRAPRLYRLLSAAPHDHVLERTSPEAFDLVVSGTPRHPGFWELVNRDTPPPSGTKLRLGDLNVTVLESNEGGFTRVHFDFGKALESTELCFVTWSGDGLRALTLPPPGEHLALPYSRGPAGL